MSKGHHNYKGAVSISYDAHGVYLLKCPTGTLFSSFEELFKEFDYHFAVREGEFCYWGRRSSSQKSHGAYQFDLDRDRILLKARNLHPKMKDPNGRVRLLCDEFCGEIVFRDDCGRKISAYHVRENFIRVRLEMDASRPRYYSWRGIVRNREYREDQFRKDPVPCTGKRRRYKWDNTRPPVFREIAGNAFVALDEDCLDHDVRVRVGRSRRRLESHLKWDYSMRDDWRDRSWKRHRENQWK